MWSERMGVLTDSRSPVEVDGSRQTDGHTVPIDSGEVARTEFLGGYVTRGRVVRGREGLFVRDLFPGKGSYFLGDV